MLSGIPPFEFARKTKLLYIDKFIYSSCTAIQRAKKAWMMRLVIPQCINEILPLAVKIEQYFCNYLHLGLCISPYVCAYFLMFYGTMNLVSMAVETMHYGSL